MKRKIVGTAFILLSILIVSVSAFVYESAQQTLGQTVVNIATITLKSSALGNLEEGETKTYTKTNVTNLGAAITLTTTKASVYLHLSSDLASQSAYYTTYNVVVKIATKPTGGTHTVGETVATLSLASPNSGAINLDVLGTWTFDFEVTTTAKTVTADQATTVTITVTAEST
ncbi:MAG TPA: hypothetical protein VGB11_00675 [Candidatus Bathyarchaeia archaeon]|jgi:hypothetical protein